MMPTEVVMARLDALEARALTVVVAVRNRVAKAEQQIDGLTTAGQELVAQVDALVGHVETLTARVAALETPPTPEPEPAP